MLEVLGALLWGAAIFGGQSALAAILGNPPVGQLCALFVSCRDRTTLPDNGNLQKALLELFLKGIQATTSVHLSSLSHSEQIQVKNWLAERSDYLNRSIRNCTKIQQPLPLNASCNLLLGTTPSEIAPLAHRQRSKALQALKNHIEEFIALFELPMPFRYNFQQDWLPGVYLSLAEAIKTNPFLEEFLLAELQLHIFETVREAQTALQHIRWLFNNPQNFLNLVQIVDFDVEILRCAVREVPIGGQLLPRIVQESRSIVRPDTYSDSTDPKVSKVLELLEYAQTKQDSNSAFARRDRDSGFARTLRELQAASDLRSRPDASVMISRQLKSGSQSQLGHRPTWRCVHTLTGHSDSVVSVAFSPRGNILASASWDRTIKIWQLGAAGNGRDCAPLLLRTITDGSASFYSVAFSPQDSLLASGSWDKTVKIWQLESSHLPISLVGHSVPVYSVAFSPIANILASGSGDETIKLWQWNSGQLLHTLSGHSSFVYSVAFSPATVSSETPVLLASGSADKTIKIWDAGSGQLLRTLLGDSPVTSVAFSSDGQTLVCGSADETIKLWQLETRDLGPDTRPAPTRTLTGHSGEVLSVAVNPRLPILASGSYDKTIKLWQLETGNLIRTLNGHYDSVLSVAFSPDGQTLASGSQDKTIKIWRRL